jgi:hypothetical protein
MLPVCKDKSDKANVLVLTLSYFPPRLFDIATAYLPKFFVGFVGLGLDWGFMQIELIPIVNKKVQHRVFL